ncbi:MAG: HD domain-containing protein, partial [bacterium]|nr:HD domain-containing protein [bacterium]
ERRKLFKNKESLNLGKNKLLQEMELYFGKETRRIAHAKAVLSFAEQILHNIPYDKSVNPLVVIGAAVLHDIGIHVCEQKYGSTAGQLQEKEGPPIARAIMEKLGFEERIITEVCDIIGSHHSPGEINTLNFKVLYDADWLVNLKDEVGIEDRPKLPRMINKVFLTEVGKTVAKKIYLGESKSK